MADVFIIAISSAAIGYVVMSFIMTATPMSMHVIDGFSLENTKFVIQSHVVAMFLPSLFTPWIVKLMGLSKMMIVGLLLYFICIAIALSGHALDNYWFALILLGFCAIFSPRISARDFFEIIFMSRTFWIVIF